VIAGLSLLLGLLWLIPTAHTFFIWPSKLYLFFDCIPGLCTNACQVDIVIALCWFAAFGLEVDALGNLNCGGAFSWGYIGDNDLCGHWKAAEAFSFLSALIWLVSGILVCGRTSFGLVLC
jgi:hypothetical protein